MMRGRSVVLLVTVAVVVTAAVTRSVTAPRASHAPAASPSETQQPALARRVDRIQLANQTLAQALAHLGAATRTNLLLDAPAFETAGVELGQTRDLTIADVDVDHALRLVLAAYIGRDVAAGYAESDNVIVVSTRDEIDRRWTVTYGYDVRDFAERFIVPNTIPPPPTGAYQSGSSVFGSSPRGVTTIKLERLAESAKDQAAHALNANGLPRVVTRYSREECLDMLTRLIQDTIEPDTWRDNGGQVGTLREAGGVLFVGQTAANQERLRRLLYNLRRLREAIDLHDPPGVRPVDLFAPVP